ncbi:MAG TPA: beta-ketoacyl synthase N-terminal-like domain-containing protein, partial [Candidatus Omnitrophota bacterium]|nr:beta-ketoacyl synthase N-terminal-like domain-containing protein [Candidatus Omnitrophota bacterium]
MGKKRVVISGIGVISPLGIGRRAFWDSLSKGREAIKKITLFDSFDGSSNMAAHVKEIDFKHYL